MSGPLRSISELLGIIFNGKEFCVVVGILFGAMMVQGQNPLLSFIIILCMLWPN